MKCLYCKTEMPQEEDDCFAMCPACAATYLILDNGMIDEIAIEDFVLLDGKSFSMFRRKLRYEEH